MMSFDEILAVLTARTCMIVYAAAVASPGFVTRRGKAGNLVIGHSRRTSGPDATAAR